MRRVPARAQAHDMPAFVIHHRHAPGACGAAFSSFKGFSSPLRQHHTPASCNAGNHDIWWCVTAVDADAALALLPPFVAERATATPIQQVLIP